MKSQYHALWAIAMFVLAISVVSAAKLEMSPKTLSIELFPGENITKNITFETDGIYAVTLDANIIGNVSPVSVMILNSSPMVINGIDTIPITFVIGNDSIPQSFKIDLISRTEVAETIIQLPPVSGSTGGGGGTYYVIKNQTKSDECLYLPKYGNRNISIKCNAVPKVSEIYITKNSTEPNITIEEPNDIPIKEERISGLRKIWNWIKSLFSRN